MSILVFVEHHDGTVSPASLGVLGAAREVAVRWSGIVAWVAGFAAYQWLQPTGPEWWLSLVGDAPAAGSLTIGASVPAFIVAFALYAGLSSAVSLRQPAFSR